MHEKFEQSPSYIEGKKIGYLLFWFDGFWVTYLRKGNGSMWILTMPICPLWITVKTSKYHTYVIELGHKEWIKEKVLDNLMDDLEGIKNGI